MNNDPDKRNTARWISPWIILLCVTFFSSNGEFYAAETGSEEHSGKYCVPLTDLSRDGEIAHLRTPEKKLPTAIIYSLTENKFDVLSLAYISKKVIVLDRKGCPIQRNEPPINDAPLFLPVSYTFPPQVDSRCLGSLEEIVLNDKEPVVLRKPRTSIEMGSTAKFVYMQVIDTLEGYFILHVDVTKRVPFEIKTDDKARKILVIE